MPSQRLLVASAAFALAAATAGCRGSSGDQTGAGDIPDTQAYVTYTPASGGFSVKVPEGWARTEAAGATTFTDKFNHVRIETQAAPAPPTVQSAERDEAPAVRSATTNFRAGAVTLIAREGGPAVLFTYQGDGPPDQVTGKAPRLAVERYEFWKDGREAIVTLSAAVGADNVDPWRTVSNSFRWQ